MGPEAEKVGLRINVNKTKYMSNTKQDREIRLGIDIIERVEHYVYLSLHIRAGTDNQKSKVCRRVKM